MYLKRLDVVGFKSFAERIGVDFVPGVTAVVGPNGSGKSNITDAIRWVLGEQSAKSLRGSKMEDIIFAGSDSRKALNFAEVTLTLDNEDQALPIDYNEVSVTRRVSRSGESEYLLNKQTCRLKDIVDLFMDSGLGREAFSIISQGKVEEILNSKAEERRTIFEEAAGVLKYKNRKKKAESKLTETQDNLNRVSDILHELEGQVEPLKIQASIAKDYLQQKEELEKIEVAVTVYEIEDLHAKWERLTKDLEQHKNDEIKLSTRLQGKEAKIEETRDYMTALDDSINDLQEVLLHVSEELEKVEGRKEVLKERKKNAFYNKEQLRKNLDDITVKIDELRDIRIEQEERNGKLSKEVLTLQQQLKTKQEELKSYSENIEERIESLKSDYIELLNKQATSKNELQYTEKQLGQQGVRSSKLEVENEKHLKERQEITRKKQVVEAGLADIRKKLEEQVLLFREEQKQLESQKAKYQKQETQLYQAYQFLQKAKSRQDMLEEMEEDYSGFFQGVKEILKARGSKLQGIEGAVAELIQVPKAYEVAIETALGAAMQHVVVSNEEHGRKAIQYLKQHSYGRATFLPLSVIRGKNLSSGQLQLLTNHSAFVGVAKELISYSDKYEDVFSNLLGTVVITKDLKGANELAKLLQYRCRFVTVEGDIVNPGGSMTGGAIKANTSSLLSRKGELEELKGKLAVMEAQTRELEQKVKELKEIIQANEQKLEAMRNNGEDLRLLEQAKKGELREIEIEERNINEKLKIYDLDISQFQQDQAQLSERKNELNESLSKYAKELLELNEQIQLLSEKKTSQNSSKETVISEISELKVKLAALLEQQYSLSEKLDTTIATLREQDEKRKTYEEDLALLSTEMNSSSTGEQVLEEQAAQKLQDKNETIGLISSRREERMKLHSELEDAELELKELKRQYKGLVGALKDEEVKLGRLDVELENRLSHLREEYLLSFEAAKEEYQLSLPVDEARKKVKLIRLAIEELGVVNIGAIEEYDRVSERYEFLLEQKNDLQEAKDTLFQVIDEMDEEMKKRFEQTFYGIRSHFEYVFQALFGGGRADLKLTNPEDLLNTGVEIVAQPPGKKLQNLALLSGGERSLTAIALLFSILKVRPVPFCILDEVEAALDEANVYRFSQYLKRYSHETQFIVITHRKGTMEEADVLYGVTMQESGVSKLVSVRLEETKELIQ